MYNKLKMNQRNRIVLLIVVLAVVTAGFTVWLKFRASADVVLGCQKTSSITQFIGKPGRNLVRINLFGRDVSVHERIVPFLEDLQKDFRESGIEYSFDDIQTYNYRGKTSAAGLSLHSWGIALDINPTRNPLQGNKGEMQTDIPPEMVEIFKSNGFFWGGEWTGPRDPMHFEWYAGHVYGSILDQETDRVVTDVAAFIDGVGAPLDGGDFDWMLSYGQHKLTIKSKGYEDLETTIDVGCFQNYHNEYKLKPLPDNTPGMVSGKVSIFPNVPLMTRAVIYLDNRIAGISDLEGGYRITNVRVGHHKIKAKLLFFIDRTIDVPEMKPGENLKDINVIFKK